MSVAVRLTVTFQVGVPVWFLAVTVLLEVTLPSVYTAWLVTTDLLVVNNVPPAVKTARTQNGTSSAALSVVVAPFADIAWYTIDSPFPSRLLRS